MPKIAVIVDYEIVEGKEEALTALINEHARLTLAEEPGCLRFEVIKPIQRNGTPIANKLMLTELYASEPAFTEHEKNPRMPSLREAVAPLLKSSKLTLATLD
ncbi:antibiotic biosynthesis monooxygenase [Kaistia dalseonensis]|uniref:Quinol monooxygenase YgiN n=1 Tax=Kaistia dalseonensis TaxID=410840 RepID=A0ABU0HBY3_9HYPH|nr:antibiotic biosynthesis monooxygenase family protein [Kaistia dalseonensis]MCX5496410.1 antibiotic biosynthesis monooxygenase [Kaistia dalseonensis]MDQ0439031.1 quinol monooxygenase YgiN [Kaistia dalseonensis]